MSARLWAGRALAVTIAVFCAFGLLEVVLRLIDAGETSVEFRSLFMPDPELGHRLRPGAHVRYRTSEFSTDIDINRLGVRGEEIGKKAENEFRILVLGDSMVLGLQVPLAHTFCQILQTRLNQTAVSPRHFTVVNAAVQGYGPVEEYLWFTRISPLVEPDLVIVTIFVGNDAVDAAASEERLHPQSVNRTLAERAWMNVRRLARRSEAVQLVYPSLMAVFGRFRQAPLRASPLDAHLSHPSERVLHGYEVARDCVERLQSHAAARGWRTAILLLPVRFQIEAEDREQLSRETRRRGQTLDVDGATNRFRAALDDLSIPLLDALPVFRANSQRSGLYFRRNIHLTSEGHELVASSLQEFLERRHLLGEEVSAK